MSHKNRYVPKYDEEILKIKYNRKQEECRCRLIPFEFTLQQWFDFHKLLYVDDIQCAYTNVHFIHKGGHQYKPSIERLDNLKAYNVHNCVWCTEEANHLKSSYIESNGDRSVLSVQRRNHLTRIEKIVSYIENIQEIQKPYKHLFNTEAHETLSDDISTEHEPSIEQNEKSSVQGSQEEFEHNSQDTEGKESMTTIYTPVNPEISTARKYAAFGEFIENVCGSEFNLTYSEFSKKIRRKTCSLTNKPIVTQGYFISDKTVPVSNDTFFVVEKSVGEKIDNLMEECKIDFKTMKTLCKNFNKM